MNFWLNFYIRTFEMKKLVCSILAIVLLLNVNAQKGHLNFLGVSMDCHKSSFVNRMLDKGFVTDLEQGVSVMMSGDFMDEEVTLLVGFTPKTSQVYCVSVLFLPFTAYTFSSLEMKLTAIYGDTFRKVDDPAQLRGNADRMVVWKVTGKEAGFITLTQNKSRDNPFSLIFLDGSNRLLYQEELAD